MVKTLPSNVGGADPSPRRGAKISHASWQKIPKQNRSIAVTNSMKILKIRKAVGSHSGPHCCSVARSLQLFATTMDCSTPGFPVFHHLREFAETHVHEVNDAIQPSHPLLPPSPPTLNLSQQQGKMLSQLFSMSWPFASRGQTIGASASVLPMKIQG